MYSLSFRKLKSKPKQLVGPPALETADIIFRASEFLEVVILFYNLFLDKRYMQIEICLQRFTQLYKSIIDFVVINDHPLPIQSLLCTTVSSHRLEYLI